MDIKKEKKKRKKEKKKERMGGECAFRESYNSSEYSWCRATRQRISRSVKDLRRRGDRVILSKLGIHAASFRSREPYTVGQRHEALCICKLHISHRCSKEKAAFSINSGQVPLFCARQKLYEKIDMARKLTWLEIAGRIFL